MTYTFVIHSKSKGSHTVNVSSEDQEAVSNVHWGLGTERKRKGQSPRYYISSSHHGLLHHFIYKRMCPNFTGLKQGEVIDHFDGDPQNNTRVNLRLVSRSLNNHNVPKRKSLYSCYRGVTFSKQQNKWRASFKTFSKSFNHEIDAAKAYDAYVVADYGYTCARHNGLLTEEEARHLYSFLEHERIRKTQPVKGYFVDKKYKVTMYEARFHHNKRYFYVGKFKTPHEATRAYLTEKIKLITKLNEEYKKNTPIARNNDGNAILTSYDKYGNVKGHTVVDDDKWHELSLIRWYTDEKGYWSSSIGGRRIQLHAYILKADKYHIVDHKNNNPSDNRIQNLRFATYSQNAHNKQKMAGTSSKYKGVSKTYSRTGIRYSARVLCNGKMYYLGSFAAEGLAAQAYNIKALELYGDRANLNDKILDQDMIVDPIQASSRGTRNYVSRKKKPNASSQYIGVFKIPSGKFLAQVTKDYTVYNAGVYLTEEEAALAYNIKAKEVYGELAKLNPDLPENTPIRKNAGKNRTQINGKTCSSDYRGVCYNKRTKLFRAAIGFQKQKIIIGFFEKQEEAALAYNKKATELLGDKAKLNIIIK